MRTGSNNNVAYILSIALITLFFGCTVEQTHKTLTFFFDGVDKMIFHNDEVSRDSLSRISEAKRNAVLKKNRPDLYVHQPYKEKKCGECHTPDKRLVMAMPDLCFRCHGNFFEKYAVVHGPVASGGCLNCHNQHSSKYPKLLSRQGQQICLHCHNASMVFEATVHRDIEDAECTMCHNPHGGKTRYMIKDNISQDAHRIALMDDLTYRHLYGQVFCKVPGDVSSIMEVYILDSKGTLVATAHPDANGRFYLNNLHPNENYTFRFKNDFPDCKINILDNAGQVRFVVEKNKKQKYVFDKKAYETVHTAINEEHSPEDTVAADMVNIRDEVNADRSKWKDTLIAHSNTAISNASDTGVGVGDLTEGLQYGVDGGKGKIVVSALPDDVKTPKVSNDGAEKNVAANPSEAPHHESKIEVKELPADAPVPAEKDVSQKGEEHKEEVSVKEQVTNGRRSKIVVATMPDAGPPQPGNLFKAMPGASEAVKQLEARGMKFSDLAQQSARYYDGTVVIVLNESGDMLDIAEVNDKGEFYLYDFLYFRISHPPVSSGIISRSIFLNEKMEVVETINKHVSGGRYVYLSNNSESDPAKTAVRLFANKQNAFLFSSVYFREGNDAIATDGVAELKKVAVYMIANPDSKTYLVPHAVSLGTSVYNRQLSARRAGAAIKFLVSQGVDAGRIAVKGKKSGKEIDAVQATPGSHDEDQRNRRVDVYIKVF